MGKIALTTGSALIAGALLVIAYLSAGTFILAGILAAVFLIGEKIDVVQYVFAPIAFSAAIIFAAAVYTLTMRDDLLPRFKASEMPPLPPPN